LTKHGSNVHLESIIGFDPSNPKRWQTLEEVAVPNLERLAEVRMSRAAWIAESLDLADTYLVQEQDILDRALAYLDTVERVAFEDYYRHVAAVVEADEEIVGGEVIAERHAVHSWDIVEIVEAEMVATFESGAQRHMDFLLERECLF
jgi:hypothetical protein